MTPQMTENSDLVLDEVLADFDETIVAHVVVDALPPVVFTAVRNMDFLDIHSPVMDAAMFLRGLPARIGRWIRRGPAPAAPPSFSLADFYSASAGDSVLAGWVPLGETPSREIAFGAAGKVWQPEIEWRRVEPADFAAFAEPGFAKIAASFSMRPYGQRRTLLSYEARTANTDAASRKRFKRYWFLVRIFVGVILRAALRTAKDLAENADTAK